MGDMTKAEQARWLRWAVNRVVRMEQDLHQPSCPKYDPDAYEPWPEYKGRCLCGMSAKVSKAKQAARSLPPRRSTRDGEE